MSTMFSVVSKRYAKESLLSKRFDRDKYIEKAKRLSNVSDKILRAYGIIFLIITLSFFNGGADVQILTIQLRELGELRDFLLFLGSVLLALSYGYYVRSEYFLALFRLHIIETEPIEDWQPLLETSQTLDPPVFFPKDRLFFRKGKEVDVPIVLLAYLMAVATIFPLSGAYLYISISTIAQILNGDSQSIVKVLLAVVPFVSVHLLIFVDLSAGIGRDEKVMSNRILEYLQQANQHLGRQEFEKRCMFVETLRLRLNL
ncbi:hypothetical protein HKCCE2091_07320 [Rhodobacterales bacterium HKCCE2091]|nr:hypothetical protein [Rhodobacterales bacterium HKCCE2091]